MICFVGEKKKKTKQKKRDGGFLSDLNPEQHISM